MLTIAPAIIAMGALASTVPTEAAPVIDPGDGGVYAPQLDPAEFVDGVDNPHFPLAPGSRWVYEGTSEDGDERIVVEVLDERRDVLGISAVIVRDTVSLEGQVIEDTFDWFAQDVDGNVWYLGEDTREFEDGVAVNAAGAWEAGIDGAYPGIVMPAEPTVGDAYREEFYAGEAEDLAEILETGASRTTALGPYEDVVVTENWNPLEPDVVEHKWYAPGVGLIAEEKVSGGTEAVELVEFTSGG